MSWFLSICAEQADTTTIDAERKGQRYSKLSNQLLEHHEEEITRLETELREEQQRVEALTQSNDALSVQIKSLQQTLNLSPQNGQTQLQELLKEKESQLAQIREKYDESQKKVTQLQQELEETKQLMTAKASGAEYLSMLEEYQRKLKQKDETISRLNESNQSLTDEHKELEEKLDHETRRANIVQEQLDKKTHEITRLEDEIDQLRNKVQSLGGGDKYKVVITTETGSSARALLGLINDSEDDDEYGSDEDEDEKQEFDELKYRTTAPTVIGLDADIFDANTYAIDVNDAIDTLTKDPKERIRAAVNILIECNATQRNAIANVAADVTLDYKFRLYSNNKKVLKLLGDMMKSQSMCDAEWIYKAINSKNDAVVIEILFTRTNSQIAALIEAYAHLYDRQISNDVTGAFMKKDSAFVDMCNALLTLNQRKEQSRKEVNQKWAKNDAKILKEALMDNNNADKAWQSLYELCVNRSWNHLDQIERAFNHETKVKLTIKLKKCNPNKSIARKAVMVVLQAAHSMHELFASYLLQALKKKKDDALQRVLLARSEIDLADIDQVFTNKEQFGEGKTTRVWIENSTQSSLYRYILLSLLGLHEHDTLRMSTIRDRVLVRAPTRIDIRTPKIYKDALAKFNPSIVASRAFNAAKDADDIASCIKSDDAKALKEKLAVLLPACDARQRGQILEEYPKIMEDISKVIKKGQVLILTDGFLKASIAAYDASIIEKALNQNNVNKIADVICTKNNKEIEAIIDAYKQTHYRAADLVQKVADLCEKNKRGSDVGIILDSLFRCKRNENKNEEVDMDAVASDVEFLVNTKKFKAAEKDKMVHIFCDNNWKYIRAVNRQYSMKSSMTLETFIRDKLNTTPNFTLVLLKYSCDPTEYFAQYLYELGQKFDKNKEEIARIFLTRSETDLNGIRARFTKTQYGKQLDAWIEDKAKGSRFGLFLLNILRSIDGHNNDNAYEHKYEEEIVDSPSPIGSESDNDSVLNVAQGNKTTAASKFKYGDELIQNEILKNEKRKEESLSLCGGGFIKFMAKYLKSKIVNKMWKKLDAQNKGFIEISSFPDLIAFVVILYRVKIHQQKTKTKTKPKLDNKVIRRQIEHCAIWIARTHVYDENNQFKLPQDDFQNKFASWCQDYMDKKGEFTSSD